MSGSVVPGRPARHRLGRGRRRGLAAWRTVDDQAQRRARAHPRARTGVDEPDLRRPLLLRLPLGLPTRRRARVQPRLVARRPRSRPLAIPRGRPTRSTCVAAVVLVAVVALTRVRLATGPTPYRYSSRIEAELSPQLATLPKDRRYLVRWDDPVYLGGLGFGVLLDLERRGYDVGVEPEYATGAERHGCSARASTTPSSPWRPRRRGSPTGGPDRASGRSRRRTRGPRDERAASRPGPGDPRRPPRGRGQAQRQADVDGASPASSSPRSCHLGQRAAGRLIATSGAVRRVRHRSGATEAGPVPAIAPAPRPAGAIGDAPVPATTPEPGGVRRTGRVGPRMIPRCSRSSAAW